GYAMTAPSSYSAAIPSASLALARSTNRRVMSSGLRAFSYVVMTPACPPQGAEGQQIILVGTRISGYGTAAAGIPGRGRRRGELHPRGRPRAHQPVRGERPGPPARAGTRRAADRPLVTVRAAHRRRDGRAAARPRRAGRRRGPAPVGGRG